MGLPTWMAVILAEVALAPNPLEVKLTMPGLDSVIRSCNECTWLYTSVVIPVPLVP